MPRPNVEVVRAAFASWNEGDWDDAMRDASDDVVIDNSMVAGEYRGVHHGRDEAIRMFERFVEPWASTNMELVELVEAGDRVFARVTGRYVGRDGIEVIARTGMCFTFEDGQITHILMPGDIDSARAAAGLPLE
jgi:ketosteroid isomerase-like protein